MSLTFGTGPLSAHAPKEVNYRLDGPAHKLLMYPYPRRIRAEFAGRTVLDSRRAVLLYETALPPRLYVPEPDLDASAFVPSDHSTHCPFKGDATYRTLQVGDRVVPNALWAYPDPIDAAPGWPATPRCTGRRPTPGTTRTSWSTGWPTRSTGWTCGPPASTSRCWPGTPWWPRSRSPLVLSETGLPNRYYLAPEDVRVPLEPTETRTHCPYKGDAGYWSVRLPDGTRARRRGLGVPGAAARSRPGSPAGSASCTRACGCWSTASRADRGQPAPVACSGANHSVAGPAARGRAHRAARAGRARRPARCPSCTCCCRPRWAGRTRTCTSSSPTPTASGSSDEDWLDIGSGGLDPLRRRAETGVLLRDLGSRFAYHYDLGDGWEHDVEVLGAGRRPARLPLRRGRLPAGGLRRSRRVRVVAGRAGRPGAPAARRAAGLGRRACPSSTRRPPTSWCGRPRVRCRTACGWCWSWPRAG